ncbi:tRNA pseudouridine(55) synthase TruB [Actinobacteria bacterium YIM 96077]|uniref:tRNA pseudouridine synthase B n=1 Tax=Phytoactinopolyspora halophila TaxID=1981511 RepID=A0A329QVI0_9ACTN|nr:tRNA pseudouridine(55) synthase TruB [Phytoactinopolyspora halophila]AYY12783.1 tRNA pseudouridine(55) synthase TruB [Actinobacteria bacterium YIM 96077]RAW16424.1 tRNA pseudouridine(55) synthase TruB [Phytoactinopolyspora halophila]
MTTGQHGLVIADKPAGMTSHAVVGRIRKVAGTRRVGHAGTLDPMATGVLVIGVGRATRLLGHLALTEKTYEATIRLGASTVTDDAEGEVTGTADASGIDEAAVRAELAVFTGEIRQVPSAVSAVKVDGVRSYQRVRSGEEVELKARTVTVDRFDLVGIDRVENYVDARVVVECSSGTYIRALARDVGAALGVGGHLTALRRTRVGPYRLDQARTLDQLEAGLELVSMEEAAAATFPRMEVEAETARQVANGVPLSRTDLGPGPVAVFGPDGRLLSLVEDRGPRAKYLAVFTGPEPKR